MAALLLCKVAHCRRQPADGRLPRTHGARNAKCGTARLKRFASNALFPPRLLRNVNEEKRLERANGSTYAPISDAYLWTADLGCGSCECPSANDPHTQSESGLNS